MYGFLLVFYSNFVPKTHSFWDSWLRKMSWPWNPGQRSLKGHRNRHVSIRHLRISINVP